MNYVTRLVNFGSSKLGINPSTLSGAIDVLIVEQEDGSFVSSPFYVRFGKMGVLRPAEKVVEICVNGQPVNLQMKLDEEGEAFFPGSSNEDEDLCLHQRTPPEDFTFGNTPIGEFVLSNEKLEQSVEHGRQPASDSVNVFEIAARSKSLDSIVTIADEAQHSVVVEQHADWRRGEVARSLSTEPEPCTSPIQVAPVVVSASAPKTAEPTTDGEGDAKKAVKKSWWKWSSPSKALAQNELPNKTNSNKSSPPMSIPPSVASPPVTAGMPYSLPSALEGGKVPVRASRQQTSASTSAGERDEIYLDELDDEKAKVFLYTMQSGTRSTHARVTESSSEDESFRDSAFGSGDHSRSVSAPDDGLQVDWLRDIAFALCDAPLSGVCESAPPDFIAKRVSSFDQFAAHPYELLADKRLVVRLGDCYAPWRLAAPLLLARLAFGKSVARDALVRLAGQLHTPDAAQSDVKFPPAPGAKAANLLTTSRTPTSGVRRHGLRTRGSNSSLSRFDLDGDACLSDSETLDVDRESRVHSNTGRIGRAGRYDSLSVDPPTPTHTAQLFTDIGRAAPDELSVNVSHKPHLKGLSLSASTSPLPSSTPSPPASPTKAKRELSANADRADANSERGKKTLRLDSEQVACLNLRRGANKVTFSVTTQFQGTARCTCYLYLWRYDDKVVLSDIDGTITKSDALGHVMPRLPLIGNDWAQPGVAQLFTRIAANGYRIAYLSARAIGQSAQTREYLRSVKQGEFALPDGPVFLSPSSLLHAFHREVIERRPEVFKIQCLRDIIKVFGIQCEPLYAGFGNRVNDVFAYSNVGIPRSRIFTVNSRSQVVQESLVSRVISGYARLCELVDHLFPPLAVDDCDDERCPTFAETERLDADAQTTGTVRFTMQDEDDDEVDDVVMVTNGTSEVSVDCEPEIFGVSSLGNVNESRRRERRRSRQHLDASLQFNQVVFWRDPLPDVPSTP